MRCGGGGGNCSNFVWLFVDGHQHLQTAKYRLSVYFCWFIVLVVCKLHFTGTFSMKFKRHRLIILKQLICFLLAEWLTFQNSEEGENACSQMMYKPLGTIIISKLATLSDLKEQIMTLDGLSNFSIPTVKFIRLRLLQSKHLSHVLRLHLQTLQYAPHVSGTCSTNKIRALPPEITLEKHFQLLLRQPF